MTSNDSFHSVRISLCLALFLLRPGLPARPPGVVIDHWPQSSGKYIGSPSIAVLPSGDYVASHDLFGPKANHEESPVTRVFRSSDRGWHWAHLTDIQGMFWGTLFWHRSALYLIGTNRQNGDAVIRRSADRGRTWTVPLDRNSGLLLEGHYHCAPQPVVVHDGRIWRGMEDTMAGGGWGKRFRAFMMSASLSADLLKVDSWTSSNPIARDPEWLNGEFGGWLEGNAVVTPEGEVVDILRVDCPEGSKAAVITISKDGRLARFDPAAGFIDFPGGAKKFTIRFDPKSRLYWSLTNFVPPRHQGPHAARTRNTVALISSPDLLSWKVNCIVLYHPSPADHAFQYLDWLFEGEDIVAVSRTSYDDGLGGAHNAHDANYMTFHRIRGFRRLKMTDSVVDTATLGMARPQ